jgi:hypothetical protein
LFKKFIIKGDYIDTDKHTLLDTKIKTLCEYCVLITLALVFTKNNIVFRLYVKNFVKSKVALIVILNKGNRSLLTNTCIVIAYFKPT